MKKSTFNILSKFSRKITPFNTAYVSDGQILFSDGLNSVRANINTSGDDAVVLIEDLKRVFSRGDIDTINISDGKAELLVGSKSFKVSAKDDDIIDYPGLGMQINESFEITPEILKAKKFLSKDDLRPAMTGICFSHTNKEICATDAHRLYFTPCDVGFTSDVVLHPAFFNIPVGSYKVFESPKHVSFVNDEYTFSIHKIDERYPDYRAVIPTAFNNSFSYDKKEFKELLQDALVCANTTTNKAYLDSDGFIYSEDIDMDREFKGTAKSFVADRSDDMRIGINIKFMLECVDAIDDNTIKIDLVAPNRAMIINGCVLLMPVM